MFSLTERSHKQPFPPAPRQETLLHTTLCERIWAARFPLPRRAETEQQLRRTFLKGTKSTLFHTAGEQHISAQLALSFLR